MIKNKKPNMFSRLRTRGFTLVEMLVVIVVIGILAGITITGYFGWQQGLVQRQAQSDLKQAVAAMESAKNFQNAYPGSVPGTFIASDGITLTYVGGNDTEYCIEAKGTTYSSIVYSVDTAVSKDPKVGACDSAYALDAPSPSISNVGGSSFVVNWANVTGATSYSVKYGPSTPSSTASCTSSPCTISGLTVGVNYKVTVTATSQYNSKTSATINVTTTAQPVSSIASGGDFTCALMSNKAYCSGRNDTGQLGTGTNNNSTVPVPVSTSGVLSGLSVNSISAGQGHACVIASDSKAYCWGAGGQGALGQGSNTNSSEPVAVVTSGVLSGKTIKQISAGAGATCVIASDNLPYCWGYGYFGQLGNAANSNTPNPVAVSMTGPLAGKTAKYINTSGEYTCMIASDNLPYCWGYGVSGRLGNNGTANSNIPVAVVTSGVLSGKTSTKIIASYSGTTCVIASSLPYCWGNNVTGSIGNTSNGSTSVPVAVTNSGVLSGKTIIDMDVGNGYTCAVASDSKPYCWGSGYNGRLGTGNENDTNQPVAVVTSGALSGKNANTITVGLGTPCVTTTVSEAYCWAYNSNGEYGNNTTTASFVPVRAYNQ